MDKELLHKLLLEAQALEVSSQGHILAPFREDLAKAGFINSRVLRWKDHQSTVKLGGKVIIIHTPPTKSKKRVMFLTLEDEEGLFDLTVFEDVQKLYAKKIKSNPVLLVSGEVNRFGLRGISVVVKRVWTIKEMFRHE